MATDTDSDEMRRTSRHRGLLLLLVLVAGIIGASSLPWASRDGADAWYDPGMTLGSYEGKSAEEVQADLDRQVREGEMEISVAPLIHVDHTTGLATVRMENSRNNHRDQRFTITLEDGGVVYRSGAIKPGTHVQTVELSPVPEIGTYSATVTIQGYDQSTHQETGGSVGANVSLEVE